MGIASFIAKNRNHNITIADYFSLDREDIEFERITSENSINIINDDFSNEESFSKLDKNYDHIYMLASVVGVNRCIEEPNEVIRINTALIQNTLKWIVENDIIAKVLFSSSSECYSATTDKFNYTVPTPEDVPLTVAEIGHPRFTYAITKMLGESAFLNYGRIYNFPVTIVRYQNIYGPRMGFKHVIPHLVERFYGKENPFKIYGADQTRAFCYISDASEGTVLALERENSNQEIFHIGSPNEITIAELVRSVGQIMNYQGKNINAPTYPGSVERRCPDIYKAIKLLNYNPKIDWKDGLNDTVLWYKNYFESGLKIQSGGFKSPENLSYNN